MSANPISAGTVSVDSNGNVTGSGFALVAYNALVAEYSPSWPNPSSPPTDGTFTGTPAQWATAVTTSLIKVKQDYAKQAQAAANGIVAYMVGQANVWPLPSFTTGNIGQKLTVQSDGSGGTQLGWT